MAARCRRLPRGSRDRLAVLNNGGFAVAVPDYLSAMLDWRNRYGALPSSYDWSRTHATHREGEALERLKAGEWPAASVIGALFGTWRQARDATRPEDGRSERWDADQPGRRTEHMQAAGDSSA